MATRLKLWMFSKINSDSEHFPVLTVIFTPMPRKNYIRINITVYSNNFCFRCFCEKKIRGISVRVLRIV